MEGTQIVTTSPARTVRIKRLILPTEHGSWGFLLEPVVAGLAVAFSPSGSWIALMVIGAFLTRQPLKFLLLGLAGKGFREQSLAAFYLTLLFGSLFVLGLAAAAATAAPSSFYPFLAVLPLAAYQIFCDVTRRGRELLPEMTGATAISSSAAAIAIAGGMPWPHALALWVVFIGRQIPSIIYVRTRLRLDKGKRARLIEPVSAHFLGLGAVGMMAATGFASYLTLAMFVVLLGRSVHGLSPYRKRVKAMRIGIAEVIYGTLTVASVIIGHYIGV